ncbi:hypothetical protein PVAND_010778 [Polypedilum vanderplanki]|uniref:Putative ionotropic receptor ligand binding domain-containing protein n=1 Tax=Polypedilum vanderplanki TaxID=319348 RepID=A0A9J6CHB2_POLVA|nr:hypothetical protein PVAND_010778 [Polypedilum vanderplanki]
MLRIVAIMIFLTQSLTISKLNKKNSIPDSIENLGLILKRVMDSFYCEESTIDLTTINKKDTEIIETLAYILPIIEKCSSVRISSDIKKKSRKKFNNIAVIKDKMEFDKFLKLVTNENFDYRGFYTIIFTDKNIKLESIFAQAWKISIPNLNAIIKSSYSWKVFTYYPFSNEICGNFMPYEVDINFLFPQKITNLQQCKLKFPKLNYYPGLIIKEISNGIYSLSGIDGDIVKELMVNFNFTIKFLKLPREEERWGKKFF